MPITFFQPQQYLPGYNHLINGNFDGNLISASVSHSADYSGIDAADQWRTELKVSPAYSCDFYTEIGHTFGYPRGALNIMSNHVHYIGGVVQSNDFYFYHAQRIKNGAAYLVTNNQKLTLSFWVKNAALVSYTGKIGMSLYVYYGAGGDTPVLIKGKTVSITTDNTDNGFVKVKCTFTMPTPATITIIDENYLEVRLFTYWGSNVAAANFLNDTSAQDAPGLTTDDRAMYFAEVKLEQGEEATFFTPLPAAVEMQNCLNVKDTAWAQWTPTLTWTGATPTNALCNAFWQRIHNTVNISVTVYSTDSNATTGLTITLPVNAKTRAAHNTMFASVERYGAAGSTYSPIAGYVRHDANQDKIQFYDFKPATDGQIIVVQVSGQYEVEA
jgi:glycine cleavage system H lipoate-binding protein